MSNDALRHRAVQLRAEGRSRREIGEMLGIRSDWSVGRLLVGTTSPEALRRPRAKDELRARARELPVRGSTYARIAAELGVSTSSCSLWLRDLPHPAFERSYDGERWRATWGPTLRGREIARQQAKFEAARSVLPLAERDLILAGAIAYWCEGAKDKPYDRRETVTFVNSDRHLVVLFLRFLSLVSVTCDRITYRVSIHESADVQAAVRYWAGVAGVDPTGSGQARSSAIR